MNRTSSVGIADDPIGHDRPYAVPLLFKDARTLYERGVRIGAGSDTQGSAMRFGGGLVDELERLTRAGLSARAALLAATRDAARALRLDDQLGSIAVGMTADLLIVDGTPWEQVTALRNVRAVIQDGQRVVP